MERLCDLHTHSYYSDGTCSPEQLLRLARELGLSAIALTDHNTVAGLPEFLAAGEGYPVEAIPGIEFTAEFEGEEVHILGLYLKPEYFQQLEEVMEKVRARKAKSERELTERLQEKGMDISYDALSAATPGGNINRAHIAAEMVRKGYVSSSKEAFSTWLSPSFGLYTPAKRPDAFDVIRLIRSMGAVAVLAHPFLSLKEGRLRKFLPQAVQCGLDGMETIYSKYDPQTTALAERVAAEFGLLPSGGSDFHGDNKPDICMGTGRGELRIPAQVQEALRQRLNSKINNEKTVDFYGIM